MTGVFNKFIGDKAFYKRMFIITLPIMIQNIITNFVSLLDNLMVGRLGTEQMSGVAAVNQLVFVFNLCIFGAISGAGIFSAQFHGKGDAKGVRDTFRIKMLLVVAITVIVEFVLIFFGESLIMSFLSEGNEPIDIPLTLSFGLDYLKVMLIGLPAFAIMQAYADTLRSTDKTVLPMVASVVAVFVNLVLNFVLIFGVGSFEGFGVVGAAMATVSARFTECAIVIISTHIRHKQNPFIVGAYRSFKIPGALMASVAKKGFPLMINEILWSVGMTIIVNVYSLHGIEVFAAQNISSTVSNLFNCTFFAFGNAIAIIVGQSLGAGQIEKAKDETRKIIASCVMLCVCVGTIMVFVAPLFPEVYNTEEVVKEIASSLLVISAVAMPIHGLAHASYFTLRSGGKTFITFLFDSCFVWVISIPTAFLLTKFTNLGILPVYAVVQGLDLIKVFIGLMMLKSGIWINNLVADKDNK